MTTNKSTAKHQPKSSTNNKLNPKTKTNTKTKTKIETHAKTNSKAKLIVSALGLTVVAGGAGYAYNDIVNHPGSIYTESYYKIRSSKH